MKSGWQIKTIGEVCDLATGGTPSRTKPEYFGGDIKWLVSGDINKGEIFDCEGRITEAGKKNSNAKLLPMNSVMIALNGQGKTRGTVALLRTQATCNQSLVSISPKQSSGLLPEFLYANLHGRYEEIRRMTSDDDKDRRGLNMGLVRSIMIPIPSLEEQKRIISKLDETFAGLAKAKENAEKNLQNARALFESHLESVFTQRGPGWVEKPLGKVCDLQNGYAFKSGDYINASNTLNIRMSNIRPGGSFDPEHNQRFLPDSYARKYAAFLLREGDLIIAMTDMAGDPKILGVPTLVGNLDGRNFLMNQRVGKLFGFSADVRPPYLRYFLTSPLVKQFYKSKGAGGLQINISKGDILSVKIPLPDVTNQDLVVKQLDALTEETQRLARLYEQKLEALESFKKSILHEAFTGNL